MVGGLFLLSTLFARADASLNLAWDYEGEDDLAGFRIYYGFMSGFLCALTNEVGLVTEASVSNLVGGETYYFAVSCVDVAGRESDRSNEITYTVPVSSTNELPVVSLISVETDEDQSVLLPLIGTNFLVAALPSHGKVAGSVPDVRYVPDTDFSGLDSFTLFSFDGSPIVTKAEVSIHVRPVNDPPWTSDKMVVTVTDEDVPIHLVAGDVEAGTLEYVLETQPAFGTLDGDPPDLRYHPSKGFEGQDRFTYRVRDEELDSHLATVQVNVLGVDRIPVVEELEFFISEDVPIAFLLNSYNPYRGSVSAQALDAPLHGALIAVPPQVDYVDYQPGLNYYGPDNVTFLVRQSETELGLVKIKFELAPVNDVPHPNDSFVVAAEDTPTSLELTGSDVEGDPLRYEIATLPAHGVLSGAAPNLFYLPATNYNGLDQFTFRVSDAGGTSEEAILLIIVSPENDAPAAIGQSIAILENQPATIVLRAKDVDGDELRYEVETRPLHGRLSGDGPNLLYFPTPQYNGPDSFTFKVRDGSAQSELALVAITVFHVPQITAATLDGSGFTLTWSSSPGRTYLVWFSESLNSPTWRVVSSPIVATGTRMSWTHPGREQTSSGFYILDRAAP
jgi:Big-like domain-containing protein